MTVLRSDEVTRLTGLSRTTLWRLERRGEFPLRVHLGANSIGWIGSEVREWIDCRPRGMAGGDPNATIQPGSKADRP